MLIWLWAESLKNRSLIAPQEHTFIEFIKSKDLPWGSPPSILFYYISMAFSSRLKPKGRETDHSTLPAVVNKNVCDCICMWLYLYVTLSVCDCICMWLSVCDWSVCDCICMWLYLYVTVSVCDCICMWLYLYVTLSVCDSICMWLYLYVTVSVCDCISTYHIPLFI